MHTVSYFLLATIT
uniref:Uncharacterized protein n=1 Tax=Arundo donax TaxID=35708 RepID=A0A0A9A441_ARUDO